MDHWPAPRKESELVALMDKNGIGTDASIPQHVQRPGVVFPLCQEIQEQVEVDGGWVFLFFFFVFSWGVRDVELVWNSLSWLTNLLLEMFRDVETSSWDSPGAIQADLP